MEKKKINGWKLTAIISLIINALVAILLAIGLGVTPRSMTKVSAYGGYDNNKIITSTSKIDSNEQYYLYFDWEHKQVLPDDDSLYWIPDCYNVTPFGVGYNSSRFSDSIYVRNIGIFKSSNTGNIIFRAYVYRQGFYVGVADLYSIKSVNSRTLYIEKNVVSYEWFDESLYADFRSFFDGTISLNSLTQLADFNFDLTFITGYFSQYSVQSLSIKQEFNIQARINGVNFESEYSWKDQPENNNYSFISNTLIVSKGSALFDMAITNYTDIGYMEALDGVFKIGNWAYYKLYWVWKEVDFNSYANVTYGNYMMSYLSGQNTNHYYYLDSLCPFNDQDDEVLIDMPIVTLHSDTVTFSEVLGNPSNTLNISLDSYFTNNRCTILAVQLFPSQQVHFSNLGYLFKIVNNFYSYNGEIFIIDDTDGDISGNNSGSVGNVFVLITNAFESLMPMFSLMILPGISLGMLFFLPIVAFVIVLVIRVVKR